MDSFWQFSDKLRLDLPGNAAGGVDDFSNSRWAFNSNSHLNHFSNISIGDSIWARTNDRTNENWPKVKSAKGKPEIDRNFDGKGKGKNTNNSEVNIFNDGWKFGGSSNMNSVNGRVAENPKVSKYNYNKNSNNNNNTSNGINSKNRTGKSNSHGAGGKSGKGGNAGVVDKRFKTLPPSESFPHSEPLGGYIFVCNNDTMEDDLRRQLFGLPQRYRDSVRAITPGLPLFLYNYSTHQLHGVFEAASFGGTNIDPTAWEDKKCPGESRFPAQVRIVTRKVCPPLEEDSFRPVLHHYDGPKFRLQLSIPEALDLLDIFEEKSSV